MATHRLPTQRPTNHVGKPCPPLRPSPPNPQKTYLIHVHCTFPPDKTKTGRHPPPRRYGPHSQRRPPRLRRRLHGRPARPPPLDLQPHPAHYGSRFRTLPSTSIPRLYHSVATLLPSGEVLIAGSNPSVGYSATGHVNLTTWPYFFNNDHRAPLLQQQRKTSEYPTEYRVEIFRPEYMDRGVRPTITSCWWYVRYGQAFGVEVNVAGRDLRGETVVAMVNPGFHTHGLGMGQRMVVMDFTGM